MQHLRRSLSYIFGCLLLSAASCTGATDDKELMLVSIEPQRKVLEQIVGDQYRVEALLANGSDPETFDPSAADRMKLDRAVLYFGTGVLPFEEKLQQASKDKYVNTCEGMQLLYGTHAHHNHESDTHDNDHQQEADPHYWSSIKNMRIMAANMRDAVERIDTAGTMERILRYNAYVKHLDSLDSSIGQRLKHAQNASFAVWHPSLSYFARDYSLRQLSLGMEGKDLSAKGLREAIDHALADSVRVFFFQKEYDSRQAEAINDAIGSRFVIIDPLTYDWEEQLNIIADEIARP